MSDEAKAWALKQPVPMSSAKFVLYVMANQVTTDLAFLAVETIAKNTALNRKTVLACIERLEQWGLIEDTGERRGRTGRIPVYRLLMGNGLFDNAPHSVNRPKNGTVPKTGPLENHPRKSEGSGKQSQKRNSSGFGTQKKLLKASLSLPPAPATEPDAPTPPLPTFDPGNEPPAEFEPTPAGLACAAMKKAGLVRVNPSHPLLLKALDAGVTIKELADTTIEVLGAHKGGAPPGLAYVCTTALNRRLDAARAQTDANPSQTETRGNPRPAGRQSLADQAADRAREMFAGDG